MPASVTVGPLQVANVLFDFVNHEVLPGSGVEQAAFWRGFAALVERLAPKNRALLEKRDRLLVAIDGWHRARPGAAFDAGTYRSFLRDIGYWAPEPATFAVTTAAVDAEIATLAGPQLVVPVSNARYALNAANARWGSLYDALYGTDVISEAGGAEKGDRKSTRLNSSHRH